VFFGVIITVYNLEGTILHLEGTVLKVEGTILHLRKPHKKPTEPLAGAG